MFERLGQVPWPPRTPRSRGGSAELGLNPGVNPGQRRQPGAALEIAVELLRYHSLEPVAAIDHLALLAVAATEFKLADLVIIDVQQGYQGDLFFFAFGAGLLQQGKRAAAFDKPLARKKSDAFEIIVPEAFRVMAGHDVRLSTGRAAL